MAFSTAISWVSGRIQGGTREIAAAVAILLALTTIASYFQTWYRLRHVPGPFLNSLTVLVQLKKQYDGNFHLYLEGLQQKYGVKYIPKE